MLLPALLGSSSVTVAGRICWPEGILVQRLAEICLATLPNSPLSPGIFYRLRRKLLGYRLLI